MGYPAHSWCEVLDPDADDTRILARYTEDYYAGEAAAVARRHGRGWVAYLGTFSDESFDLAFMRLLTGWAGMTHLATLPKGVEVVTRSDGERDITFVINHTDIEQPATIPLAGGTHVVSVPPHDVVVL